MKKVLIISYLFPPIGGGGVPRALKMSKYLPNYGWDTVVLTANPKYHVSLDQELLKQVPPQTVIYRADELDLQGFANLLRKPVSAKSGSEQPTKPAQEGAQKAVQTKEISRTSETAVPPKPAVSRLKGKLFSSLKKIKGYLMIPDDQILWVSSAIKEGLKAIEEQKVNVIFSTSGPYSNHLVAKALARKTGLPWIADFRDPWTQNMHRSGVAWREKVEEGMEAKVMEQADIITTVTHTFAKNFKLKYPNIKQLEVIHNGYDPEDYQELEPDKIDNKLTFAYTGIFYQERNPRLFFKALAELIAEGKVEKNDLLLRFAGVFDYPGYDENQRAAEENGLQEIVQVLGHLPHKKALSLLNGSDILMLIGDTAPGSEAYIPGKLYEYLAVKKPILALSVEGESTQIIERFGIGRVVEPTNFEVMKRAILDFYQAWKEGRLEQAFSFDLQSDQLAIYQRDHQAGELAVLLNELSDNR